MNEVKWTSPLSSFYSYSTALWLVNWKLFLCVFCKIINDCSPSIKEAPTCSSFTLLTRILRTDMPCDFQLRYEKRLTTTGQVCFVLKCVFLYSSNPSESTSLHTQPSCTVGNSSRDAARGRTGENQVVPNVDLLAWRGSCIYSVQSMKWNAFWQSRVSQYITCITFLCVAELILI